MVVAAGNVAAPVAAHECMCRANGQNYSQGQVICIRGHLARCEMNLNVSSWKALADSCPESQRSLPVQVATLDSARPAQH